MMLNMKLIFNAVGIVRSFRISTTRYMSNYGNGRDVGANVNKSVQPFLEQDFLLLSLRNATNTSKILDMVHMHGRIMNCKHISQALRGLFTLQKSGHSDYSTKEILSHPDFKRLCSQLRSQAGVIEVNDTLEALKVVSYVGVAADSTIVQVLMQLLRHNVNYLNLQQIIFLDFLLNQFRTTPLGDALKIALPLVFEIQLPVKMSQDNIHHLADYLFYATRRGLSDATLERIANAIASCSTPIDVKTAKSIVWSICDTDANAFLPPVLKKALDCLVVHLDELNYNDVETTLSKLISRYSVRSSYFYHQIFFDSCVNYLIENDLGFKHSIYALRKLSRVNYVSTVLLDYMSRKVDADPSLITEADPVDIYSIVVATALTEYRPVHWDLVKDLISKTENLASTEKKEIIWIKFASCLCLLGIFNVDVLNKCLDESFLHSLFKKSRYNSDFENYSTIHQCITMFKPELEALLPSQDSTLSPRLVYKKYRHGLEFPMERALHNVFGGETYVTTNISSILGHQIDHVILLRKGGYPVANGSSNQIEFIEDIESSADKKIVVIQGLKHFDYTLNNRRLKYSSLVALRTLELRGYLVVPICLQVWESLPDFEKIPYLMQAVKEKTEATQLKTPQHV